MNMTGVENITKQIKLDNESFKCQMKTQFTSASKLNTFDKSLLIFLRLYSAFLRRLKKITNTRKKGNIEKISCDQSLIDHSKIAIKGETIKEGDTVYILPFEDIKKTLDDNRKAQGLEFMEGMQKFCGTTAKVMKNVKYI